MNALVIKGAVMPAHEIPWFLARLDDKLVHAVEYFLLFWAAVRAFRFARNLPLQEHAAFVALSYGVLMGAFTECLQFWVPTRSAELADFGVDLLGTALAWVVIPQERGKEMG